MVVKNVDSLKDDNLICTADICIFGVYDYCESSSIENKINKTAEEYSKYIIPESNKRIYSTKLQENRYDSYEYFIGSRDLVVGHKVVGYYSKDDFTDFENIDQDIGILPLAMELFQETEPIFWPNKIGRIYSGLTDWTMERGMPKHIENLFEYRGKHEVEFKGHGKDKNSHLSNMVRGIKRLNSHNPVPAYGGDNLKDSPIDVNAKRNFWKKIELLDIPRNSIVLAESDLSITQSDHLGEKVIEGVADLHIYVPKKENIIFLRGDYCQFVEERLIPFTKYKSNRSDIIYF